MWDAAQSECYLPLTCNVTEAARKSCGAQYNTTAACAAAGCCWDTHDNWCYSAGLPPGGRPTCGGERECPYDWSCCGSAGGPDGYAACASGGFGGVYESCCAAVSAKTVCPEHTQCCDAHGCMVPPYEPNHTNDTCCSDSGAGKYVCSNGTGCCGGHCIAAGLTCCNDGDGGAKYTCPAEKECCRGACTDPATESCCVTNTRYPRMVCSAPTKECCFTFLPNNTMQTLCYDPAQQSCCKDQPHYGEEVYLCDPGQCCGGRCAPAGDTCCKPSAWPQKGPPDLPPICAAAERCWANASYGVCYDAAGGVACADGPAAACPAGGGAACCGSAANHTCFDAAARDCCEGGGTPAAAEDWRVCPAGERCCGCANRTVGQSGMCDDPAYADGARPGCYDESTHVCATCPDSGDRGQRTTYSGGPDALACGKAAPLCCVNSSYSAPSKRVCYSDAEQQCCVYPGGYGSMYMGAICDTAAGETCCSQLCHDPATSVCCHNQYGQGHLCHPDQQCEIFGCRNVTSGRITRANYLPGLRGGIVVPWPQPNTTQSSY